MEHQVHSILLLVALQVFLCTLSTTADGSTGDADYNTAVGLVQLDPTFTGFRIPQRNKWWLLYTGHDKL